MLSMPGTSDACACYMVFFTGKRADFCETEHSD